MIRKNVGIIGLGTVGGATALLLDKNREHYANKLGIDLAIKGLSDMDPDRIDQIIEKLKNVRDFSVRLDSDKILDEGDINIVVESIGGTDKAREFIVKALKAGKSVVTPNKDLIATHGKELLSIARENNVHLLYGAAVAGAIPILDNINKTLISDKITKVFGIMNGTCNYILTKMENEGMSFEEALTKAQKKGYAEQDPTNDVKLKDTLYKLIILIKEIYGEFVNINSIHTEGIGKISLKDLQLARKLNCSIKAVGFVEQTKEGLLACFAEPVFVDISNQVACVDGVNNCISVHTEYMGEEKPLSFVGPGAGGNATATAVVTDIINAANLEIKTEKEDSNGQKKIELVDYHNIKTKFFLRFELKDIPGALEYITGLTRKYGINIAKLIQPGLNDSKDKSIAFVVDKTDLSTIRNLLIETEDEKMISGKASVYRVI